VSDGLNNKQEHPESADLCQGESGSDLESGFGVRIQMTSKI